MNNIFLEVINSVNLVNKKMNDNMKSLFSKYVKLLAVILLSVAGVGQVWGGTLFSQDFTALSSGSVSTNNSGVQVGDLYFYRKNSSKTVSWGGGTGVNFNGQNMSSGISQHSVGFPVTGINENTITITITCPYSGSASSFKYQIYSADKSTPIVSATATGFTDSDKDGTLSITITNASLSSGSCWVQLGEKSSLYKIINSVVVTTPDPSCTFITPSLSYTSPLTAGGSTASATLTGNTGGGAVTYSITATPAGCATINASTGVVTPVNVGTATVTASIAAAGNYCAGEATADITINCATPATLAISGASEVEVGSTATLTVNNTGAGYGAVTWSSGATGKATVVSSTGVVTGVSTGAVTITANQAEGTKYCASSATHDMTVVPSSCTAISPSLSYASTSLTVGGGNSAAPTLSGNTGSGAVTYSSSNTSVATVNASTGVVTPVAAGSATITASIDANGGYCAGSATANFTVAAATYSITYDCDGAESGCPSNVAEATALPNPLPSAPTKSGYTFDGWFTNSEKTVEAVAGASLTANATLYAKWTAVGGGDCDLHIWFDNNADATAAGITNNEGSFFGSVPGSSGNSASGSITIDGTTYNVSYRSSNTTPSITFTVPSGKTGKLYAVVQGGSSRSVILKQGSTTIQSITWENSVASHDFDEVPAGTYTVTSSGNVGWCMLAVKLCDDTPCETSINPTLSYTSTTLSTGATSSDPTITDYTGNGTVTYESSNTSVATVNESTGVVTAVAPGNATITATIARSGIYCAGTATATFEVTCGASNITLSESSTSMKIGKSVDLSSKVSAHNGNLSYTVQSGGSFGTLVGSTFTGSSAGEAVVRITNTLAAPCSGSSYEDYTITVTDNCGTDLYGATISGTTATAINSDCSASCKNINGGKMSSNGAYVLVTLTDGTYLQDGDVINVDIATKNETSILEITSDAAGSDVLATKDAGITTGDNLITLTGVSSRNLNKFYLFRRSASSNPVLNSVKLSRECCTAPSEALAITSSEASVVTGGTATISVTPGTGNGNTVSYSASAGTITSEGEFTAPAVATPTVVTITATQAANDKCAQVATVNVTVNPSAEQDIYVSKGGVEVPAGSSIDFSNVEIASDATTTTTETYTFSYRNDGLATLGINTIVVTGDAFIGGCDGTCPSVTNGNSSSFTVSTVTGLAPGTYNGTVTINSNDPDESSYTFNIRYVVVPKYAVTVQFRTTKGDDVAGATATIDGTTTSVSTNPATTHTVLVGSGMQTITCTEPSGYRFSRWQIVGGASSSNNSFEFEVTKDTTIRAIYVVADCSNIFEAKANSSTTFAATTGTVSVTSASSESNSPGSYNGETYDCAVKLGSNTSAYVTVTAAGGNIQEGDSIIVVTWSSGTNKTHGFKLKSGSGNGASETVSTKFATLRYLITADDIEDNGTVKVFRLNSDTRFCKIIVKRCDTPQPVNVTITPADNSNNVDVNSDVVVALPAEFYVGTDCDNLEYIDLKTTTTAFTSAVEDEIKGNIKIYKFNEGTSSYDDVTSSFDGTAAAVATAGTGVTVTFTPKTPMSYSSQYRVEVQGVSNEECKVTGNISTFITGEEPLPQITVKDNGDVTTFPNGGSLNVANLMPAERSGDAVIKIYNTGTASGTLDISSMEITGEDASMFTILSCTVGGASDMTPSLTKGGDPAVVTIRFTKDSGIGTYHAILNIASNSTTDAAFALNLIGTKIDFELPYVYESGCTDPVADPALGVRQDYTREGDVPSEITIGAGAEDSGVDANVIPHYSLWSSLGGCSQNGESAVRVGDKKDGKAIHINTGGKAIGKITVKWAANGLRKISIEDADGVPFAQSLGWEASNECHTTTAFINDCDKAGGTGTSEAYIRVYGPEDGAMAAISYLEITPCDPEIKSSACELINVESANQQETAPGEKVPYTAQGTDGFIAVTDNCGEGGTFTPTTLTVSNGATISPKVGVAQTINAQGYVTYVVTAADAMTKKEYHVYPECQPVLDNSKCYASEITINSTNGGNIYKTTGEDKKIAVVATASDPGEACGVVMIDGNANGANHTVHYLDQDDIPDGGYKIEGPKSVCVGSTGTYRITNAPESNSPIYTWYLPHPNEAGFAVVGSEIAYDAAFTTALSAKFTPNASGYYKPQEVGEMLGIGQFVTATVSVEVSKDVFENRLMDIFSGPELKLLAPNVIESGDVSVALSLNFDFEDANCRLLSGVASYSIKATSRSATPIVSVDAGCADENNRLVLTASQGSGVDVIEATKLDWTFSDPDVNILVASGNSVTVNIGKGAPDIYATVIASNGCGTTDPNPTPIAVPYGTPATTWIGKDDNNWNNPANWTRQVPTACTDVTIAAVGETVTLPKGGNKQVSHYPSINGSDEGVCDEITFNRGAGVKGLEKLSYRRAYVKNAYQRNKWYTLTNPLKEMVSGDYYFNGVPLTYMKKFDVTHSVNGYTYTQKWTKDYTELTEPLASGQGFAYQVTSRNMRQVDNPSAGDQEVIFPRMTVDSLLITELHKFNPLTGNLLSKAINLTKTENAYRFAFDGASVSDGVKTPTHSSYPENIQITLTGSAGDLSLIGNPMMCHLDLGAFRTTNASVIENQFVFWNGVTNTSVAINTEGTVATAEPAAGTKIAPMQGFFVKNVGNGGTLNFNVASHFTTDDAGGFKLRSADALSDGTLYVTGNDGKTTSYLSVRKIEGASNGFAEGEDAEKIFNAYAVSEISTLAGGVATDINHFSALPYETPLAVNTTADKDTVDLTFKGAESFENVNVTLVNKKTGEEINLKDENKYKFIFTKDEAETTLVLRFASDEEITTDAEQAETDASGCDVQIFTKGNNTVRVMSSSSNQIREVSIYDAAGKLIAKEVATGNGVTVMDKVLNAGARNVVVTAVTDNCVKTEILQLK